MSSPINLTEEVRALERLGLDGLRQVWRQAYGPVPKLRSVALLRRLLSWRMQAARLGDGGPVLNRLIGSTARPRKIRGPAIAPGMRLRREWRGVVHEAVATEDGFEYRGASYPSLSKVALVITGAKWNGPRFFGLREVP